MTFVRPSYTRGLMKRIVVLSKLEDDEYAQGDTKPKVGEEDEIGATIGVYLGRRKVLVHVTFWDSVMSVAWRVVPWRCH